MSSPRSWQEAHNALAAALPCPSLCLLQRIGREQPGCSPAPQREDGDTRILRLCKSGTYILGVRLALRASADVLALGVLESFLLTPGVTSCLLSLRSHDKIVA